MNKASYERFTLNLGGYTALDVVAKFNWWPAPDLDFELLGLWVEHDAEKQDIYEFLRDDLRRQIEDRIIEWISSGPRGYPDLVAKD